MTTDKGCCGCCAGMDAETPARIGNPPGHPAISYRIGVHATFKESLLARLSSGSLPALAGLGTREDTDFTIALCDALATTLDVLGFYQERIANENFLRTATERRSILELARLIGYRLAPGCAASTYLAFTVQEVPGSAPAPEPTTIPAGTRAQSIPGPGEMAQSFETVEDSEARAEWNAIPVQTSVAWRPAAGDTELYLEGVNHGLAPGDVILIVGQERLEDLGSERWDIRLLSGVTVDAPNQRTRLSWANGLGDAAAKVQPAARGVTVFVFRQRAALFGHNAPDPRLLGTVPTAMVAINSKALIAWKPLKFAPKDPTIELDAAYPKILPGSWFALVSNEPGMDRSGLSGYVELYAADTVSFPSHSDFGLSGRITRLTPDIAENFDRFADRQKTGVLAQPEPLPPWARPLQYPLYGAALALGRLVADLVPGCVVAVRGKRARVALRRGAASVELVLPEGGESKLEEGDSLRLLAAPEGRVGTEWHALSPEEFGARLARLDSGALRLTVMDRDGREGSCETTAAAIELAPAAEDDETVSEIAFVSGLPGAVTTDRDRTTLALAAPLRNCYERASATVCANVAPATHGETVNEILGSGDARQPNARFTLRQSPLTFVSADTPDGRQSTLQLRVNDLLWTEVRSLYASDGNQRACEVSIDDDARATVAFGDGVEGARPPSGDHNIRATYRKGLGLAGNVATGKIANLLSRPLGVKAVWNPEDATGGEDPETLDRARANAPLTVMTLDRAVSVLDYQDYARAFAGIAKAHAMWIPSGIARGVFITVAGEEGAGVPQDSATFRNLLTSLRRHGDPLMPLRLVSYRDARFELRLAVKLAEDADGTVVLPKVEARLRETFCFEARCFGQGVSADEVSSVAQLVSGVAAVRVALLRRTDSPPGGKQVAAPRLFAALPVAELGTLPLPAELLTLEEGSLIVEPMP